MEFLISWLALNEAVYGANLRANMDESLQHTAKQFDQIIVHCRELFIKKTRDYGTAWRILRTPSLTDQIFIKAQRIRTLEEKGSSKVGEGIDDEFVGIINYAVMALIQMQMNDSDAMELSAEEATARYDEQVASTKALMLNKNHDYGEAWREMRVSSFTDLILMKLLRIKQIEDNEGKTLVSEGIDSGYRDILNYAVFALIQLGHANVTRA
jgi:hypothetical protein